MGINWLIIDVFKICKNTACLSNDKIAIVINCNLRLMFFHTMIIIVDICLISIFLSLCSVIFTRTVFLFWRQNNTTCICRNLQNYLFEVCCEKNKEKVESRDSNDSSCKGLSNSYEWMCRIAHLGSPRVVRLDWRLFINKQAY